MGYLKMILEIANIKDIKKLPIYSIALKEPEIYELRVIIWSIYNIKIRNSITNLGDFWVTGLLILGNDDNSSYKQSTDIHIRAKNGNGNFNWRFVYKNIKLPYRNFYSKTIGPRLKI